MKDNQNLLAECAAIAGSQISREAFEVISLLMCGWTLHAAKHKAYSESKGAK